MILQPVRIDARVGEFPPMTLGNGDGKVVGPAPSEIQIYCGAVFPHRQDLALYRHKLTPHSRNPGNIF
jgi:hypothetical protein